MTTAQALITIINECVKDQTFDDVSNLIKKLDIDHESEGFCDEFELGLKFEELLDEHEISVIEELSVIFTRKFKEHKQDLKDDKEVEDARRGQY